MGNYEVCKHMNGMIVLRIVTTALPVVSVVLVTSLIRTNMAPGKESLIEDKGKSKDE